MLVVETGPLFLILLFVHLSSSFFRAPLVLFNPFLGQEMFPVTFCGSPWLFYLQKGKKQKLLRNVDWFYTGVYCSPKAFTLKWQWKSEGRGDKTLLFIIGLQPRRDII